MTTLRRLIRLSPLLAAFGAVTALIPLSTPGMYANNKDRGYGESGATGGTLDVLTDDIRAKLIDDADYTANFATDVDLDDVADLAEVATLAAGLGTKTFSAGVFDAADDTFSSVSGDGVESVLVYEHNATPGDANLIVLLDCGGTTTPNGNDINVQWDSGADKIFSLNG